MLWVWCLKNFQVCKAKHDSKLYKYGSTVWNIFTFMMKFQYITLSNLNFLNVFIDRKHELLCFYHLILNVVS